VGGGGRLTRSPCLGRGRDGASGAEAVGAALAPVTGCALLPPCGHHPPLPWPPRPARAGPTSASHLQERGLRVAAKVQSVGTHCNTAVSRTSRQGGGGCPQASLYPIPTIEIFQSPLLPGGEAAPRLGGSMSLADSGARNSQRNHPSQGVAFCGLGCGVGWAAAGV
jgi:hypothetical protein